MIGLVQAPTGAQPLCPPLSPAPFAGMMKLAPSLPSHASGGGKGGGQGGTVLVANATTIG
jgi:hypothetical protein